jgi:hypothetical protein
LYCGRSRSEYTTLPLLSTPEALDVIVCFQLAVGYKSNKLFAPITSLALLVKLYQWTSQLLFWRLKLNVRFLSLSVITIAFYLTIPFASTTSPSVTCSKYTFLKRNQIF